MKKIKDGSSSDKLQINTTTNANSLRHTLYKHIVVKTWNKNTQACKKNGSISPSYIVSMKDEFRKHVKEIQYW